MNSVLIRYEKNTSNMNFSFFLTRCMAFQKKKKEERKKMCSKRREKMKVDYFVVVDLFWLHPWHVEVPGPGIDQTCSEVVTCTIGAAI